MCLIIKKQEPILAIKDIVCYKVLDEDLCSSIRGFQYSIGVLFKTKLRGNSLRLQKNRYPADSKSVQYLEKLYPDWRINYKKYNLVSIGPGFHSFLKRARITEQDMQSDCSIWKCIIPTGSLYYVDPVDQLMVSDQIIIKKMSNYLPKNK